MPGNTDTCLNRGGVHLGARFVTLALVLRVGMPLPPKFTAFIPLSSVELLFHSTSRIA